MWKSLSFLVVFERATFTMHTKKGEARKIDFNILHTSKAQVRAEAESGFTVSGFNYLEPYLVCFSDFDIVILMSN